MCFVCRSGPGESRSGHLKKTLLLDIDLKNIAVTIYLVPAHTLVSDTYKFQACYVAESHREVTL